MEKLFREISIDSDEKDVVDELGATDETGKPGKTDDNTNPVTNNALNPGISQVNDLTSTLNNIQINFASLLVGGEEEKVFFDRKVRPLIDEIYFLSFAAQGMSITAQNFQSNAFVRKKQVKTAVDLTYDILKEAYCMLDILKERNCIYRSIVEGDLKRCGGNPINYTMDESSDEDLDNNEHNMNCDED